MIEYLNGRPLEPDDLDAAFEWLLEALDGNSDQPSTAQDSDAQIPPDLSARSLK